MKKLKFQTDTIDDIINQKVYRTWRLFDDKHLELDDILQLIDTKSSKVFGHAKIIKISVKHIVDVTKEDMLGYKQFKNQDEIIRQFRKYYGDKVKKSSVLKIIDFEFLGKKLALSDAKNTTKVTVVKIYADGGSRGNPGPSACSYVIVDNNKHILHKGGEYLGITTNNQAEYRAVLKALQKAIQLGVKKVDVYLDSLLVVNQLNGEYKVRNRDLWPIHRAIKKVAGHFNKISFTHIPRAMNQIADSGVNHILDSQKKSRK